MPNYNKNSVFAVSGSGTIPNKVDDLVFFDDISREEKSVWDEFERLMGTGDYEAAHNFVYGYEKVDGYFADLFNMMVNRLYAAQNLLIRNKSNIDAGRSPFDQFVKPKLIKYQQSPTGVEQGQVWIGSKNYMADAVQKDGINKLKITWNKGNSKYFGLDFNIDDDGIITINGTCTSSPAPSPSSVVAGAMQLGAVDSGIVSNTAVWSYWNYYISGSVPTNLGGKFYFRWTGVDNKEKLVEQNVGRTANMHGNLIGGFSPNTNVTCLFIPRGGETYDNLKISFMICKTAETTPGQKYIPYGK